MKAYVVTANTYKWGYGSEIELFGVYSDKEKARKRFDYVNKVLGFQAQITKVDMDEAVKSERREYLGGYFE